MDKTKAGTQDNFVEILHSLNFENILKHPNILIAANFWDEDRYLAAKECYRFMRMIDDMIDDYKSTHPFIHREKKIEFLNTINRQLAYIHNGKNGNPEFSELKFVINQFGIPLWPFETFARSMIYDIYNDGFPTFESFLDYSMGASVAPAYIFVHLCGITTKEGEYQAPEFNVRDTATPCALFSYLVHIIRDFQKDQLDNLNYFPDDVLKKHAITRKDLTDMANGYKIMDGFRNMIREYYTLADNYRQKTIKTINYIKPLMAPRYQLSIEIIFNLYLMVFERIDTERSNFCSGELNPTMEEILQRVTGTIREFHPVEYLNAYSLK